MRPSPTIPAGRLGAGAVLAPDRPVPRARAVCGDRRLAGDRLARRPDARRRATVGCRWTSSARASVPDVDLLPYGDAGGVVRQVTIAGRTFAVHPGWNRLALGLRGVSSLTRVADRSEPARCPARRPRAPAGSASCGFRVMHADRGAAPAGRRGPRCARAPISTSVGLTYLFQRDDRRRPVRSATSRTARGPRATCDSPATPSRRCSRIFELPAARSFSRIGLGRAVLADARQRAGPPRRLPRAGRRDVLQPV